MPIYFKPKKGSAGRSGPNVILERPKLAILLGAICSEWGSIENILEDIFLTASHERKGFQKSTISKIIFESFKSFPSKKEAIDKLLKARYSAEIQQEFKKAYDYLHEKSRQRNELIHATWHVYEEFPEDLIIPDNPEWARYTEADFKTVLENSNKVYFKLTNFFFSLTQLSVKIFDRTAILSSILQVSLI